MVKILFGGGCLKAAEEGCLKKTLIFDNDLLKFEESSPFIIPRRGGQFHKIEDNLYVFGGCEGYRKHLDSIEIYKNNEWNILNDTKLPNKNSCFSSININKKSVIIFGGFNGFECLNDVYQIINENNEIKIIELPKLITRLKNSAVCYKNNQSTDSLLFGGWDESRTLKTIFEYNLEKQQLFMDGLMCIPLEGHTITNIFSNKKLSFIIGGYDGISVRNSIFLYNYEDKSMKKLDICLKIPRENHSTIYDDEKKLLFIVNGWNGHESLNSIEIFELIFQEPWLIAKNEIFSPVNSSKLCTIIM
ncbi:Kelch-type beta propeller domain-containing protein [Strongyloides ratti]|uniref:Kelch-type beta propeller domain-containing protein n=1 Tax=Strongyloides ratti TaxID=34506 RepID=A0A090MZS5_STRRB|nr:Kelch-type beta propeller domain-containing protein [Strongyloides ratti]CEF69444.1 Kelch-type beta propeller domain-containing protein [Strongyloides ratti]